MNNSQATKPKRLISRGDIFLLGSHKLLVGDARDTEAVNRLLGDEEISLILADPPYGISVVQSKEGFANLRFKKNIENDDISSEAEYSKFTSNWLFPVVDKLERYNSAYIFNSDKMIFALREGMQNAGFNFSQLLIWIKNHSVIGRKDYLPAHELIAFGWHGTHKFMKAKDKSVIYCPKPNKSALHSTMKPVSLIRRLILNSSKIGDVVYDPFLGSGTCVIASEHTRRRCFGIEVDLEHCQTIINRFEKLTGIKAKKL